MRKGFTLVEALVAVTILGLAAASISGVLSTSLRNVSRAEDYQRVTLLARAQMHELLALERWNAGQTWKGQWAGDYRWSAVASPVPRPQGVTDSGMDLMRLTLVGVWQTPRGAKTYTLETARLQQRRTP